MQTVTYSFVFVHLIFSNWFSFVDIWTCSNVDTFLLFTLTNTQSMQTTQLIVRSKHQRSFIYPDKHKKFINYIIDASIKSQMVLFICLYDKKQTTQTTYVKHTKSSIQIVRNLRENMCNCIQKFVQYHNRKH